MASFLEDLLKKMQNAPHVGIPKVTNPKVPTKVERDAAEYAARERAKPKADYGSGSSFDQLMRRIASSPHPEMRFGDPAFNQQHIDIGACNAEVEAFMEQLRAKKAARKAAKLAAKNEETPA
jgi:hypothetical protein